MLEVQYDCIDTNQTKYATSSKWNAEKKIAQKLEMHMIEWF